MRAAVVAAAALGAVTALAGCTGQGAVGPSSVPSGSASAASDSPSSAASVAPSSAAASSAAPSASPAFDRSAHSLTDPDSIWVVVDKRRPLQPKDWVPPDLVQPDVPHTNTPLLRKPAAAALEAMVAGAKADGVGVVSLSAYRPYTEQRSIYDRNVQQLGLAKTLQLTAKPGYSEHQTGLADDLGDSSGRCGIAVCFASTAAGRWLAANSWRYGFILRYPEGYGSITGIQYEPWHFRYVGIPLATELHRTGVKTLEQFFGLPAAPDY